MELRQKGTMEFNMEDIKNTISATISELNDKAQAYETQISELNSVVEAKDAETVRKITEEMTKANAPIFTKLYQAAQAEAQAKQEGATKNDDGSVNRVTHDGQHTCDEGISHGDS